MSEEQTGVQAGRSGSDLTDHQAAVTEVINLVCMQQADSMEPSGCRTDDLVRLLRWDRRRAGSVRASLVRRGLVVRIDNSDVPGYGLTSAGAELFRQRIEGRR